jgi:hypothetical protein
VLAAVAAVIVLALVLDSQDLPRSARPAAPRPASLTGADVTRIARRVERIRQIRFRRPVTPLFVGRAQAVRMIEEGTQQQYPASRQRGDEEALKLLGLLRPSDSLARAFAAIDREQILGFYDDRRKRLVVVRDQHASRPLLEITLAHELTHALEDQRFGLDEGSDPNDDTALAHSALAEGSATDVMLEYGRRYFTVADALAALGSTGQSTRLPTYVEDTLLFPYLQGLRFVQTFRGSSGSWKAIDNVLRFRRPATEEQVLHTAKYATGERGAAIRMPDLGLVLGGGWQRMNASSVGELDLRELFKIVGGRADDAAAAGWGGGRFELWRRGSASDCPAPCVSRDAGVLSLAWDTEPDRREAERALAAAFERGLRARKPVQRGGTREWSSRGGVIAMSGSRKLTEVVFAPDGRTTRRLTRTPPGA